LAVAASYTSVTSTDGTPISVRSVGDGPGIVLVPGAGRSAHDYARLAGYLAPRFTVHAIDRRGRGQSGPQGDGYSIEREVEDVSAVLTATGSHFVFGHSYGGLIGLEAARELPIERLAVWEPAVSRGGSFPAHDVPLFAEAVQQRRYALAQAMVIKAVVGWPYDLLPLAIIRALVAAYVSATGRRRVTPLVTTMPRELAEIVRLDSDGARYSAIGAETLLLAGARSRAFLTTPPVQLARVIPHAEARIIAGLAHMAPDIQAPAQVAEELTAFFSA
jgi:pimeloyl-ACP methyl ester carboxylesterase